jgi:hypothetical protein
LFFVLQLDFVQQINRDIIMLINISRFLVGFALLGLLLSV